MRVKELIDSLKDCHPDAIVYVFAVTEGDNKVEDISSIIEREWGGWVTLSTVEP